MAYCKSCGMALRNGAAICDGCGASAGASNIKPAFKGLSDKWAWLLALSPVFYWILGVILFLTVFESLDNDKAEHYINMAVFFVVSAPFLFMDIRGVKKRRLCNSEAHDSAARDGDTNSDKIIGSVWLWIAASLLFGLLSVTVSFIVISIYLVLRARKTDRKYGYAIMGCVLSVLSGTLVLLPDGIFGDVAV